MNVPCTDVSNVRLTNLDAWIFLENARPMFDVADFIVDSKDVCTSYGSARLELRASQHELYPYKPCETVIRLAYESHKVLYTNLEL